jgi:ubiquinone/menaquinone biosynthesis C-methylase UbiE
MAHVSLRTIRFYDKQNILKPSFVNKSGARFYTQHDFARLQQILLLKYLGFSLADIKDMTINDTDYHILFTSLKLQLKLVQDRIEQMQMVEKAIYNTTAVLEAEHSINWSQMLELIHLTNTENSLKSQYQNANNISARINLHRLFSQNKQGWFPWIFKQCNIQSGMTILEIGCGNGALWTENLSIIPSDIKVLLSDVSEGMLRDARRAIGQYDTRFSYDTFDCCNIPSPDNSFDLIVANHVLFYCDDIIKVCSEINRVLKQNGHFICSTYGANHMKEISELVQEFDGRINLSADKLYEKFGLENGYTILKPYYIEIQSLLFDDLLIIDTPEPLIEYILSCHGNQNQFILEKYKDFFYFISKKLTPIIQITKEAGIFICKK